MSKQAVAPRRAAALPPDERRSAIVAAALPLLLEHGERVTSRQIADAAGIAEGTIFRVFTDKDALIAAVVDTALDTEPLEREFASVDPDQPFEQALLAVIAILQRRVVDIWRLFSAIGPRYHEARPMEDSDVLVGLFKANREHLRIDARKAARLLRTLTLSTTHPMMVGEPLPPKEIASLFLYGVGRASASEPDDDGVRGRSPRGDRKC